MATEIPIPFRGVTNGSAFIKTPGDAAPLGTTYNLLPHDPATDRRRGGKRFGIKPVFPSPLGSSEVQALGVITRASAVVGQRLGTCTDMVAGTSREATGLGGQVFGLDSAFGLDLMYDMDVTGTGPYVDDGPATNGVGACAISPDGRYLAVASNYFSSGSGQIVARIVLIDLTTGLAVATRRLAQAGTFQFINTMVFSDRMLFVCTNEFVNVYWYGQSALIYGSLLEPGIEGVHGVSGNSCLGWANECIQAALSPDGVYLYVAFNGTGVGRTLLSGVVVTPGINASMWRSGVMRFRISNSTPYLIAEAWGVQLPESRRYFEGASGDLPHNYWRLSEQLHRKPQGGYITGIAVDAQGNVIISHTNTGRGPDNNPAHQGVGFFDPAIPGANAIDGPFDYMRSQGPDYSTVTKISPAGALLWSADTDSIVSEINDSGFFNDIPTPNDDQHFPSIQALCIDTAGDIYAGGALNRAVADDGINVFKIDGRSGGLLWGNTVGAVTLGNGQRAGVPQAAMCIGPGGQPVVCAFRNDAWDGASGGDYRTLFVLDPAEGDLLTEYALGTEPVSALCVASGGGRLFFGIDSKV